MKCETCFWMKLTKVTSATNSYVCQLEPLSVPTSPNGRCSHWRFSGREYCGNCHFFSDYACVIDGPYRGAEEQKVAEGEWCGRFKGRMG